MIEWDKLKTMPEAKKTSGVQWDELKAMPDVSAIRWDELKRLREKPIYAAAIRRANERLDMAEMGKKSGSDYEIGLDETWDLDYDGKSTEELLYELACEKYGVPNDRGSYLKRAGRQVLLGNYTDDVTALGTAGQIALGLAGLDAPADLRDLYYDLSNWEWTWAHAGQTALDAISLLPGVGAIKYADEAGEVLQNGIKSLDKLEDLPKVVHNAASYINKGIELPSRYIDKGVSSAKAPLHSPNTAEALTDDEWDAAMGEFLEILDERKAAEGIGKFSDDTVSGGLSGRLWHDDADELTEGTGDAAAKASNKTIVIGETMERVKKYAAEIGAETYKEFKYYYKTKAIFGEKLANFIGGVDNALWLIGKMVQKYKIVDLGLDMKRLERSPYYLMESVLAYLYKYKDYAEDFMKGAF